MKVEAAKFQRQKLDFEIDKQETRRAQLKGMMESISGNLEFLKSGRARIISLHQYAMAKRNLRSMAAEMEGCEKLIYEYQQGKIVLDKEVETLNEQIRTASVKILEFKKRG